MNKIICFLFGHDFRSVNHRQRKCARCRKFQVKDYYGAWVTVKPFVTELYPSNNDNK